MSGYVLADGAGDAYDWHGARIVMKARGADTHGQLAVMESTYPGGLTVPAHVHDGEDEMLYVLTGVLRGFCGEEHWTAGPGSFIFVPRDHPHGFVVVGAEAARAVVVVGPARLDSQVVAGGVRITPPDDDHPR